MSQSLAILISEAEVATNELPMPPFAFALIALAAFGLGLATLWAFRGTAQKLGEGSVNLAGEDRPGTHADTGHDTHQSGGRDRY